MPCEFALASIKVPARKWRTRAELTAILADIKLAIERFEPASLRILAKNYGISPSHLQRLFTSVYQESPSEMSRRVRLKSAADRLRRGERVEKVAAALGYSQPSAFSRAFKAENGLSPRSFSKKCQVESSEQGG